MTNFPNNCPLSFCSLYWHHDTTDFFYRPQSSKMVTDIHDTVAASDKRRCRTNLRNAELSKRTFRIFLEKQILSHMEIEIQKNIHEAQSPLTEPGFHDNKSNYFSLNHVRLALPPSQTITSERRSCLKNHLSLPDLGTDLLPPGDRATNAGNYAIVNYDTDSEINVCGNFFRSKSKITTYAIPVSNQNNSCPKVNKAFNKGSGHTLIYDNGPEWFQDNETVSVHGSLLSETISDGSTYSTVDARNINRRRCRWRRIFFCCVN
ncbi:uncharacterized protein LOC113562982 [Ooceraea biroi]|uniref:uncharacterized protein LOC113562982 n=1 Tax=Ooceraea biroi TaxID=2015173 RepID=UPI000F07E48A|nr:uncharacterized protein LOC113562982 [Ooceraea biroi]